jgi:hypothetical protein
MNLIALRPFRNHGKIHVEDALHPQHIERGQRFSVGEADTLKELEASDHKSGKLVASLILATVAAPWTPESEAKVMAENSAEKKRLANVAELDRVARLQALGAQWQDLQLAAGRAAQAVSARR